MHHPTIRPLAILAATAALVAVVPASGSAAEEQTFKIVEKGAGTFRFVDNPPRDVRKHGPSIGDLAVFSRPLFDDSGKRVGRVTASCTFVPPGKDTFACVGAFVLQAGTIYGTATVSGEALRSDIAIIGGTGAYEGARGSIVSVSRSHKDNAPADDTVHLLP